MSNASDLFQSTKVDQWKYTACRYNFENANGFYTFSHSQGVSQEEKRELCETIAHYTQPDYLPLRPTEAELRKFPVAFSYFTLKCSDRKVLCRTCAVGQDYGGSRYGNFFSHAFILEKFPDGTTIDWEKPILYWNSKAFATGLTPEEINLGRTPEALQTLTLKQIPTFEKFEVPSKISTLEARGGEISVLRLRSLVDAFLKALSNGKNLVIFTKELKSAVVWLKYLYDVLPCELTQCLAFTTYSYDPLKEKRYYEPETQGKFSFFSESTKNFDSDRVFIYFAPPKDDIEDYERGNFVVLNFDEIKTLKNNSSQYEAYARNLSDDFLTFLSRFTFSSFREANRTSKYHLLDYTAHIYAATRDPSAVDFSQRELLWRNAFELLRIQSNDVCIDVFNKLLDKDYSKDRRYLLVAKRNKYTLPGGKENSKPILQDNLQILLSYFVDFASRNDQIRIALYDKFVQCWGRHTPKADDPIITYWTGTLRDEIRWIFEKQDPKNVNLQSDCLKRFLIGDLSSPYVSWLILAIAFYLAIYQPERLECNLWKNLKNIFENLPKQFQDEILMFYCNEFKTEIKYRMFNEQGGTASVIQSYEPIFEILDLNNLKEDFLKGFLVRITENSRKYWRRGVSYRIIHRDSNESTNDFINETSKPSVQKELVFLNDEDWLSEKGDGIISSNKLFQSLQKTNIIKSNKLTKPVEPGADALLGFLLEKKNVQALNWIFRDFNREELTKSKKFCRDQSFKNFDTCFKELLDGSRHGIDFWIKRSIWIMLYVLFVVVILWGVDNFHSHTDQSSSKPTNAFKQESLIKTNASHIINNKGITPSK